jgi:hypothetical protein
MMIKLNIALHSLFKRSPKRNSQTMEDYILNELADFSLPSSILYLPGVRLRSLSSPISVESTSLLTIEGSSPLSKSHFSIKPGFRLPIDLEGAFGFINFLLLEIDSNHKLFFISTIVLLQNPPFL